MNNIINPWKGLASYDGSEEQWRFCGRNQECYRLSTLVENNVCVTLYGASGVGKTSLLKAGVLPNLQLYDYLPIYIRLSEEKKEDLFADILISKLAKYAKGETLDLVDNLKYSYLWRYFCTHRFFNERGNEVFPLLVLDQFEEVLRGSKEDRDRTDLLLKQIYTLINGGLQKPDGYNDDKNYRFLISIREDFLFALEDSIDRMGLSLLKNARFRLRPLGIEQAKQVVTICSELLPKNVEDREYVIDSLVNKATLDEEVSTLLLSLICYQAYEIKKGSVIDAEVVSELGINPLKLFCDRVLKNLKPKAFDCIVEKTIDDNGFRLPIALKLLTYNNVPDFLWDDNNVERILVKTSRRGIGADVDDIYYELLHDQLALAILEYRREIVIRKGRELKNRYQRPESRSIAKEAMELAKSDSYLARLLTLEVLPKNLDDPDRPYVPEADAALRFSSFRNNTLLRGHTDAVYSVRFSPDGKRIISESSGEGKHRIWDVDTGLEVYIIEEFIQGVDFYQDSQHIIYTVISDSFHDGIRESKVEIRNIDTGETVYFSTFQEFLFGFTFSYTANKNLVAVSCNSTIIELWDVKNGVLVKVFSGEKEEYYAQDVMISPDGKMVAAGTEKNVRVWHVDNEESKVLLQGHSDTVGSVCFSPDGKRLVTASWDKTLKVWDLESMSELKTLKGHSDRIFSVAYSQNGEKIASGGEDNTVFLWNAETGELIKRFEGHTDAIESVQFSPNGKQIVSASKDKTIRIWEIEESPEFHKFNEVRANWFNPIAISPVENTIAYAVENVLILADIKTKSVIRAMCDHSGDINTIAFSPNGKLIVTGSADNTLLLWNVYTGKIIQSFIGHTDLVYAVSFSPSGKRIVSSSKDKTLKLWDVESGRCLLAKNVLPWQVAYNPSWNQIVYSTFEGKLVFCNSDNCEVEQVVQASDTKYLSFIFFPNGKHVVTTSSRDGVLEVWDAKTGGHINTFSDSSITPTDIARPGYIAFDLDGKKIISITGRYVINIWNALSGVLIRRKIYKDDPKYIWDSRHLGWITSAVFTPDGDTIISSSADKIIISDIEKEKTIHVFGKPCVQNIKMTTVSPDNNLLAIVYEGNNVPIIRNLNTGIIVQMLIGHEKPINSLAFNPNGSLIVTTSDDYTTRVWDVNSGHEIKRFYKNQEIFNHALFNPEGTKIICTSRHDFTNTFKGDWWESYHNHERTVEIHNNNLIVRVKDKLIELIGHTDIINTAFFSSDGNRIVTSSHDKNVIVWDVDSGKKVHILKGHTDAVNYAEFSSDGQYVVSASNDYSVKLWDARRGLLLFTFKIQNPTLKRQEGRVYIAKISPNNQRIISVSSDLIIVWNAKTGKVIKEHQNSPMTEELYAEFSNDGKYVGIKDGNHHLCFDVNDGEYALLPVLYYWDYMNDLDTSFNTAHLETITSIRLSMNGRFLVSASEDATIKIWDASNGELKKTISNENLIGIKFAVFNKKTESIISIDKNYVLKVWNIDANVITNRIENISSTFSISPDGMYIISKLDNSTIAIRDIESGISLQTYKNPKVGFDHMLFSPCGNYVILTSYYSIYIWDFPPLQKLIDQTRERFKNRPLTKEERNKYYLE